MESNSKPMQINVSETTYNLLKDQFTFMPREPMDIKGKGEMRMYFLKG
jgi:class 3 adenylate cyclase